MTAVAIIGGGRWARTIAGVLATLPTAPRKITLHSRHNASGIAAWIAQRQLAAHVSVVENWPDFRENKPDAVIIANRVSDHEAAAIPALEGGVPVLIEKPVAIGAEAVRRLQARATSGRAALAASHVFLFARYFEAFIDLVAKHGQVRRLEMEWQDGCNDVIRGEIKSYDPAVPVFDDVLPHVVPLLTCFAPDDMALASLTVGHGGAEVAVEASAGRLPVHVRMVRNAERRRRVLTVETANGPCVLDFSTEPGFLSAPGLALGNGDPEWDSALRPLGSMLTAFLKTVRAGGADSRLSPGLALTSAVFADSMRGPYAEKQRQWLADSSFMQSDARDYALQEISGRS